MARQKRRRGFARVGRSRQYVISSWQQLAGAAELDSAFWVATGAPVSGINMDSAFLDLVDTDDDGRIMTAEVRSAITWIVGVMREKSGIDVGSDSLSPDALEAGTPEAESIEKIADRGSGVVTLALVRQLIADAAGRAVSNEGVVLPSAIGDEELRNYLEDVVTVTGGSPHPSGAVGASSDDGAEFLRRLTVYRKWHESAPDDARRFGDRSRDVWRAVEALGPKVAQYFTLCHAVSLTPDLLAGPKPEIGLTDLTALETRLRQEPLARPRETGELVLNEAINPYFRKELRVIREFVMPVLFPGEGVLREDDWELIEAAIAPFSAWERSRPTSDFDDIPLERVRGSTGDDLQSRLDSLSDEAAEELITTADLQLAEKLLLFQANILRLANNFVSFPELYDPKRRAVFEMGTLVIDGRHLTFSIVAQDPETHQSRVAASGMYVLYVRVFGRPADENGVRPTMYTLAVPVTAQTAGNLGQGKRGVFYDLEGTEHDAEVIAVVTNPVSIRSALARPFKRIVEVIGNKIDTVATEAEARLGAAATGTTAPAPATEAVSIPGLLAGGGVAIAALGSGFAYLASTLSATPWWHILVALGGALLAIVIPTYVSAFRRIRRRDLSAVLEASGWAINARMRLTRRQSRTFTVRPKP